MYNNKKTGYEAPDIRIVVFESNDIITVSGGFDGEWDQLENNKRK